MRIAILCNCLEPGRDGVGDSVRRLRAELQKMGNTVLLAALNDSFIDSVIEDGCLRLPANMPWSERSKNLKAHLDLFQPDFIRLDFVAFGMNKKGIVSGLVGALKPLAKQAPWVIYFHEIWLGFKPLLPIRHKLLGAIQKFFIKRLVESINPLRTWTSNVVYQRALAKEGIKADLLPLVSPIPITKLVLPIQELPINGVVEESVEAVKTETGRQRNCILAPFQVPENWEPSRLLSFLKAIQQADDPKPLVIAVGGQGAGAHTWQQMAEQYSDLAQWITLGRQPESVISSLACHCEYGLALSPMSLLGKSGSCAMLVEHGLKVIACHDSWETVERFSIDELNPYGESVRYIDANDGESFVSALGQWRVPEDSDLWSQRVVERFIQQLN